MSKTKSAVYDLRFQSRSSLGPKEWGAIKDAMEAAAAKIAKTHNVTLTTFTGPPYPERDIRKLAPAPRAVLKYLAENPERAERSAVLAEYFQKHVPAGPQTETYCRVILYRLKAKGLAQCRRGAMLGDGRNVRWYITEAGVSVHQEIEAGTGK